MLLAAGCAAGPYHAYRAAHPDWDGAFPTASADLARTVAALYAPGSKWTTTVTQIYAWRLEPESWTSVDLENLPAAPADADYAVVASLHCASNDGNAEFMRSEIVWYLLPRNRLAAWDHYAFAPGCGVTNAFQPARGPLVPAERELLERAHIPLPATASGAAEYYEKGLAFLRAGRRDDADAMLAAGDRAGTGEFDVRARLNQPHAAGRESAAQARAALVGALGAAP
jgi:hypothetical protein